MCVYAWVLNRQLIKYLDALHHLHVCICASVCVYKIISCEQDIYKSYEWIFIKFLGGLGHDPRTNRLEFLVAIQITIWIQKFFGTGRRVPKSHSSCCSFCCYQFSKGPKIPKTFLICSAVQWNFAYTFLLTLPTDPPSQIFHLFSN